MTGETIESGNDSKIEQMTSELNSIEGAIELLGDRGFCLFVAGRHIFSLAISEVYAESYKVQKSWRQGERAESNQRIIEIAIKTAEEEQKCIGLFLSLVKGVTIPEVLKQDKDNFERLKNEVKTTGQTIIDSDRGLLEFSDDFIKKDKVVSIEAGIQYSFRREKGQAEKMKEHERLEFLEFALRRALEHTKKIGRPE